MNIISRKTLATNLKQYKTPTTKDAYERGFERGFNCASWQNMPDIGDTLRLESEGRVTVDAGNVWDTVRSLAFEGESNDRDFSPFEFTASEFNKARNAEARWEAFDAGIADGIDANIEERRYKSEYEVIVGNVGSVCSTVDEDEAEETFREYVSQSESEYGRAAGENVAMIQAGHILKEHIGSIQAEAEAEAEGEE